METDPDLRYKSYWLVIGYALVALVVYLSLTSDPLDLNLGFENQDKLYHAFAYFTQTFWFSQIYYKKSHRGILVLVFLLLGGLMEYLQSFSPYRTADIADMAANASGVLLAFIATRGRLRLLLARIERLV